jgi:hypothetical protein
LAVFSDNLIFDILCDLPPGTSFGLQKPKPSAPEDVTMTFDKYTTLISDVSGARLHSSDRWTEINIANVMAAPENQVEEGAPELSWGRRDRKVFQVRDAPFALREGSLVRFKEKKLK